MRYVGSKGPDLLELTPKLLNHLCNLKLAAIEKRYNMVLSNPRWGKSDQPPEYLIPTKRRARRLATTQCHPEGICRGPTL
jgi:hypothetical protein